MLSDGSSAVLNLPGVIPSPSLLESCQISAKGFKPVHLKSEEIIKVLSENGEIQLQARVLFIFLKLFSFLILGQNIRNEFFNFKKCIVDSRVMEHLLFLREDAKQFCPSFGDCFKSRINEISDSVQTEDQVPFLPFYLSSSNSGAHDLYFKSLVEKSKWHFFLVYSKKIF